MPLVRCDTHGLLYNSENPRGCPACDQERKGRRSESSMMKELARASQKADGQVPKRESIDTAAISAERPAREFLPRTRRRDIVAATVVTILTALAVTLWLTRPRYVEQPDPPEFAGTARPLTLTPGQPVTVLFSILGAQPPRTHPIDAGTERYSYGTDLYIDAINGFVYSISIAVTNRSWRGIRVGQSEQEVRGQLALLDDPVEGGAQSVPLPPVVAGYRVYPALDARPVKTLTAEVRPPNGCLDVTVDLEPRILGLLLRSGRRMAVVGDATAGLQWVVTRIRVVDRRRNGPIEAQAC